MSTSTSRDSILGKVALNKPESTPLPDLSFFINGTAAVTEQFITILGNIGGKAHHREGTIDEVISTIKNDFPELKRIYSSDPDVRRALDLQFVTPASGHAFEDVDVAIIKAHFGVAENGAVWITDDLMGNRALPFICQHLVVIVDEKNLVPTMHEAYKKIGSSKYNYGAFIAGPSKTADIEQSLVLGAHGPKSMTVFIMA
ncbi:lactate utilization protein [Mucilaginibacter sp. BJC16-A38]|uniref:LutC/YkgG family protein n=1 Tax=Mucilaginibacter phenanthrenivorans TaxID=1234842 RepID=UPI002156FAF9|nr:lactate utilization protein [Mucilaginibacter phenanthrenivorans]MCR8559535.1 lactate utilization protein [Mucilaginibacter phenanthrenivorans]